MMHFLRRVIYHCWITVAIVVIVAAIALSGIRGVFTYANQYRDDLTRWLTGYSAEQFQIGHLSASIDHYRPVLILKDVHFYPQKGTEYQLSSQSITIDFDWLASVKHHRLTFRDVRLSNALLRVPWVSNSTKPSSRSISSDMQVGSTFAKLFLTQLDHFEIERAKLELLIPHQPAREIYIHAMHWRNRQGLHRGEGDAYFPSLGEKTSTVHFGVKLTSKNRGDQSWLSIPGQFYATADHLQIAGLGQFLNIKALQHVSSDLNFKVWGRFGGDRPTLWQWLWRPSRFQWQDKHGQAHQLAIAKGQLALRDKGDFYQLDSQDLTLKTDQYSWGKTAVQGALNTQEQHWFINQIPIQAMAPLASLPGLLLDNPLPKVESGSLDDIHIGFNWINHQLSYYAQLTDLTTKAQAHWPGVDSLYGSFKGDAHHFDYHLQMKDGGVHFHQLFETDWPVQNFSTDGQIDWQHSHPVWLTHHLRLVLPWAKLQLSARVADIASRQSPFLSLAAHLDVSDIGQAHRLFPHPWMPTKVADYLTKAIQGGYSKDAKLIWYGRLNDFPYDQKSGIFEAYMPLSATKFQFQPKWPALEKMQLNLLFRNRSLHMASPQSKLANVSVKHIDAGIDHLGKRGKLTINAQLADAPLAQVNQLLGKSPIRGLAASMKQLPMQSGRLDGTLLLKIPFDKQPTGVAGEVHFKEGVMQVKSLGVKLNHLNGQLTFQQAQLSAHNLQAHWGEQPLNFDITSEQKPDKYQLDLKFLGKWNIHSLQKQLGHPSWFKPARGQLNWSSNVHIDFLDQGGFQYTAQVDSKLAQLALEFPAPLNKSTDEQWPTTLHVQGDQHSGHGQLEIPNRVNNRFHYRYAPFHFDAMRFELGDHLTKSNSPEPLPQKGTIFDIAIHQAHLEPWLNYILPLTYQTKSSTAKSSTSSSSTLFAPIVSMRLTAEQLMAFQQPLEQLQLNYQREGQRWKVESKQLVGHANFPVRPSIDSPWHIVLNKAQLPLLDLKQLQSVTSSGDSTSRHSDSASAQATPAPLDVLCQQCEIGRYHFKQVKAHLPFNQHQLTDGTITALGEGDAQINLRLDWHKNAGQMMSYVKGTVKTKSTGKFLKGLGYGNAVQQAPLDGSFAINWQGSPYALDKSSLNGTLKWKTGDGVLTDVSDKGARLFTLASLDTIRRRLQLDFRDIFDKGLYFNSAKASATIHNGHMHNDDFYMDGVAGVIRGNGNLDLVNGQVDYRISFAPKVTSSLPVLAAFAVTPVTGVAVLALSKILAPVMEVITRVDFAITGDIANPKLIEVKRSHNKVKVPAKFRGRKYGNQ